MGHVTSEFQRVEVFGVGVTPCTYATALDATIGAAEERRPLDVAALATHGLMTATTDVTFRSALAALSIVTPDGQPVRWALNLLVDQPLTERVYGPDLTEKVCAAAADRGIGIYLFGSTQTTCDLLVDSLTSRYPSIRIVGVQADRFRDATPEEDALDVATINGSGAGIVLVGRGCPRQEVWVAAHLDRIPCAMLAVGAAFDYLAGSLARPPAWMQRVGLEWLHRLVQEPQRLWRRYLITNTQFVVKFVPMWIRVKVLARR